MSIALKTLEERAEILYQNAQSYFGKRKEEIESGLAKDVKSTEESIFMKLLYGTMPVSDIANYDFALYLSFVRHALYVKYHTPWGESIPQEIFFDYVLYPRVNNEDIVECRDLFFNKIYPRLEEYEKNISMQQATLEVNVWCSENVTYRSTDDRTSSPLAVLNRAYGRCGEESVFAVTALRSIGIPARQIYTPSWPHCDDNHAWVEVWCDGNWHYLGACEPEPVLDKGWFTTAASRAMLIHSRSFSMLPQDLGEEIISKDGTTVLCNQLERYADTSVFTITVQKDGKALQGATVCLEVLNYAHFAPLAELITDENGKANITLGLGEIHVHCAKDGYYITNMVDLRINNQLTIDFGKAVAEQSICFFSEDYNMTPPKDNFKRSITLTDEQSQGQRETLAKSAKLLYDKESTYQTDETALKRAVELGISEQFQIIVAEFLVDAKGNAEQVEKFLKAETIADTNLRVKMLSTLNQKDKTDLQALVLEDHLSAVEYASNIEQELFTKYVLCPRIGLESITPWRKEITDYFPEELKKNFRAKPSSIWDWISDNITEAPHREYKALITNPARLLYAGCGSKLSKQLLFVAVCRTLGVPARLNPENGTPQYYESDCFNNVPKQKDTTTSLLKIFGEDETVWEYKNNWSLSILQDGYYQLLDLSQLAWDDKCLNVQVLPGFYRLITVKRMPNGSVFASEYRFKIQDESDIEVKISLRSARISDMLKNMELPEFSLWTGSKEKSKITITELTQLEAAKNGNILIWIEEGKEPTEHILNELIEKKDQLSEMEIQLVFILKDSTALENHTLAKAMKLLPKTTVCYDEFGDIAPVIARRMYVDPEKLPLVVVTRPCTNAIYACSGYNVGTGEMLVKILSEEV